MAGGFEIKFRVQMEVFARSSNRWRSARPAEEASRRNQRLPDRRSESIKQFAGQVMRAELPEIPFEDGMGSGESRPIGSTSYGSSSPLALGGADENHELNRSVLVVLSLTGESLADTVLGSSPGKIHVLSDVWTIEVTEFESLGGGLAFASIELLIVNPYSGKKARARDNLAGGGLSFEAVKKALQGKTDVNRMKVGKPVGSATFTTTRALGFQDFDGQLIRCGKAGSSLGIRIPYTKTGIGYGVNAAYLTFISLPASRDTLIFQADHGFKTGASLTAFVVSGTLSLVPPVPGGYLDLAALHFTYGKRTSQHTAAAGKFLALSTGASELRGKQAGDLRDFAANFARNIKTLSESFKLSR